VPAIPGPGDLQLTRYRPELAGHRPSVNDTATARRRVPALECWQRQFETDPEYDPDLCFIALDAEGVVAVAPVLDQRLHQRPGGASSGSTARLGRALLLHVFKVFQQRREGLWI
jgi:hypothetical protein